MNTGQLIQKLKNKHFLSLAGNGSMAVLAMLTVALLYRNLPVNSMGAWVFFQTVFVLLDTFRTGFLQVALIKFYTGTSEPKSSQVLGSVWFLALMITLVLLLVNIAFLPFMHFIKSEGVAVCIQWFGITFLATLPNAIASWILQSDMRFDRLLLLRVITQGSFITMIIALIFSNNINLNTVLLTNFISNALVSLYCLLAGWSRLKTFSKRTKETILEIFHFGKYSVGTSISTNLLRSSDSFIIMFMLGAAGPAALAMYNIPMRLMEIIEIPLRSFLATGMPSLSQAFNKNNKQEVAFILQKYAGMLTLVLIPVSILAIALADVAIMLIGGGKYTGTYAVSVYRIFMSFACFYPIDRFIGVTLDIIHQPRINFYKVLVMLATNIIFDFSGLYLFGNVNGVALATLFTFISGVLFGYYWLKKYLDFSIRGIFKTGYIELLWVAKQLKNKYR
ncbi:MAG: oligosaccharide flippase family protein [Sphingobacteriia bacterium]|nr:oligosaccharide flippase family protein [Sphingobacteriia bacterium]